MCHFAEFKYPENVPPSSRKGRGLSLPSQPRPIGVVFVLDIELHFKYDITDRLVPPTGRYLQHDEEE